MTGALVVFSSLKNFIQQLDKSSDCPLTNEYKVCLGITEFLDSGRKCWMLDSGRWTLNAGLWMLDSERWALDPGLRMLDSEC